MIMTVDQVADYLRVNRVTVYRLVKKRELPVIRVGGIFRFSKNQIDEWIDESQRKGG